VEELKEELEEPYSAVFHRSTSADHHPSRPLESPHLPHGYSRRRPLAYSSNTETETGKDVAFVEIDDEMDMRRGMLPMLYPGTAVASVAETTTQVHKISGCVMCQAMRC
jgi:hypothetical protein